MFWNIWSGTYANRHVLPTIQPIASFAIKRERERAGVCMCMRARARQFTFACARPRANVIGIYLPLIWQLVCSGNVELEQMGTIASWSLYICFCPEKKQWLCAIFFFFLHHTICESNLCDVFLLLVDSFWCAFHSIRFVVGFCYLSFSIIIIVCRVFDGYGYGLSVA